LSDDIKKFQDQYKSAKYGNLTIQQSANEIMGTKVFAKFLMSSFLAVFWTFLQSNAFLSILGAKNDSLGQKQNFFV